MAQDTGAFAERVFGSILGTIEIASIFMGDRLGLYAALMKDGPATSGEVAERAGVAERYAREWLEQQAAIGYLEVDDPGADPHARRYELPPGHAEVLTDRDSMSYLTGFARMMGASFGVMPELMDAYRTGGGVSWARFGEDMLHGQGDTNRPLFLSQLGTTWLPRIPGVHEALQAGGRVADVGCGTGWSSIAMALAYPAATVDGFDIDEASVDQARLNAAEMGVADRVTFHDRDAAEAEPGGGYDLALAFECIHDMPYPTKVLAAMHRLVTGRGSAVVVDERVQERFAAPAGDVDRLMYGTSILICLPDGMSHPGSAGTGTVMRPDTLRRYAQEAGFADIEILPIEHDFFRAYRLTE
ncbi:MAG: class I SAM-dependent methyltransferase [Actinomycetota bacterium]